MKFYGGIGSRDSPPEIMETMTLIASKLEERGYILRSGGAQGADQAFEDGIKDHTKMRIFLPFDGFNDKNHGYGYIAKYSVKDVDNAHNAVVTYHPIGYRLQGKSYKLMARNYHQVCGLDGEKNSEFIICWTPDGATTKTTRNTGGTGQAIRIANALSIPVYNLKNIHTNVEHFLDKITNN